MEASTASQFDSADCALSWSGGKDSALALWRLRRDGCEPDALLTTLTESYDRVSMHGARRTLLARQAESVGVPLIEVTIPPVCSNEVYEQRLEQAFAGRAFAVSTPSPSETSSSRTSAPTARDGSPPWVGAVSSRSGVSTRPSSPTIHRRRL